MDHQMSSSRVVDHHEDLQPRYWKRRPVEDGGGDQAIIECSGKSCRACTAGMIADCVAICCCPCAVVNLLTLALFKVPWMIGKKWLGLRRRKKKKKKISSSSSSSSSEIAIAGTNDNLGKAQGVEEGMFEIFCGEETHVETEKVWLELELYQIGHLGFGRVSFTGIQS